MSVAHQCKLDGMVDGRGTPNVNKAAKTLIMMLEK